MRNKSLFVLGKYSSCTQPPPQRGHITALTNLIGNGVATIVAAKWEGELDQQQMNAQLKRLKKVEWILKL